MGAGALSGRFRRSIGAGIVAIVSAAALVATPIAEAVAAPTNALTLEVVSARTEPRAFAGAGVTAGDPVDTYKFIINEDNTGDTDAATRHRRLLAADRRLPVLGLPLDVDQRRAPTPRRSSPRATRTTLAAGLDLPDGKYLISVLADGYKLDGAHFTMPLGRRDPVDGRAAADAAARLHGQGPGLRGHGAHQRRVRRRRPAARRASWATSTTLLGEVTHRRLRQPAVHDVRRRGPGHPRDPAGRPRRRHAAGRRHRSAASASATPTASSRSRTWAPTATRSTSRPPDGQQWIQTTTLEGNHDWDTWVMEGSTGLRHRVHARRRAGPDPAVRLRPAHQERSAAGRHRRRPHHRTRDADACTTCRPRAASSTSTTASPAPRSTAPDPGRLALARRPPERRPGRVGRPGRRRRPLRHHRRAGRRLPADLVGRGAEQPARAAERHRRAAARRSTSGRCR